MIAWTLKLDNIIYENSNLGIMATKKKLALALGKRCANSINSQALKNRTKFLDVDFLKSKRGSKGNIYRGIAEAMTI